MQDYDYPYYCYEDDSSSRKVPFLNMSESDFDNQPINAIGSESVPFYGVFNGHNIEIKNLTVYADPEDSGLFGYTAHGSEVKNLYLSEIEINALGYTNRFANLYGDSQVAAEGTKLIYTVGDDDPEDFELTDTAKAMYLDFNISDYLSWDGQGNAPSISNEIDLPIITFDSDNENYKYKFLISGDFLDYYPQGQDQQVKVDLASTFKFFWNEINHPDDPDGPDPSYPINASSSVSLVASTVDNYGLEHAKVISSMQFDFSLSEGSDYLTMTAHLGEKHTNNIGLIIGHCDGSVSDCYVSSGTFVMNDPNSDTSNTYNAMANGSNYGLIGKIGGTVHSKIAEDSGGGTVAGKAVGVLDFSTIYDEIVSDNSFGGSHTGGGIYYTPKNDTPKARQYLPYLRTHNSQYVTEAAKTISFRGRRVISNSDLGVFTIATDYYTEGVDDTSGSNLGYSVIRKDANAPESGNYYIYYGTGEFDKTQCSYDDYVKSMNTIPTTTMQLGYHLPSADQISSGSFSKRDLYQNYYFRFKLDPSTRTNKGFYFSDVDKTSAGGSFISKYFENRLVDGNGDPILASAKDARSGVRIQKSDGAELDKLDCSFATPNLTSDDARMYCINLNDPEKKNPVANMINFDVKTKWANVTVVAGLENSAKPAMLGVYRTDNATRANYNDGYNDYEYITTNYKAPDYAFYMPTDNKLSYFDYQVQKIGNTQVGKIGVYKKNALDPTQYDFEVATTHTSATICQAKKNDGSLVDELDPRGNETRLYAHTFKLPYGSYCLASATGKDNYGLAKVYYVCAQGQTNGTLDFDQTAFSRQDEVKNVDFIKTERFQYNTETGVYVDKNVSISDGNGAARCYISLLNTDRSLFNAALCRVKFEYDNTNGYFKVTSPGQSSTASQVSKLVVSSYAYAKTNHAIANTLVKIFDQAVSTSDKDVIKYPPS